MLLGTMCVAPMGVAVWQTAVHVPAVGAALLAAWKAIIGGKAVGAIKSLPWWGKVLLATPFEYAAIAATYQFAMKPRSMSGLGSA